MANSMQKPNNPLFEVRIVMKPSDIAKMTYEQAFSELEKIIEALESNQATLDESLKLFENGQALLQHCSSLLDNAELKVHTLTGDLTENLPSEE
jgi:exodeoxyribonuclease VII small subunit